MKKIFLVFLVSFLSVFSFSKINAQFVLTAMVDTIPKDTVHRCINEWLDLNSKGSANFLMNNNFNSQNLGVGWSSTQANPVFNNPCQCPFTGTPPTTCNTGVPGQTGPNGAYAWVGTTASPQRTLITQIYNLTSYQAIGGCKIKWWMMYGITPNAGSCEDPDANDEGVHLQYSTNNGATWTDFPGPNVYPTGNLSNTPPFNTTVPGSGGYWQPYSALNQQLTSTAYYWNRYQNNIPPVAYTSNTNFRWAQLATSSTGYDAWGIDEVEISCPTTPFVQWECPELPSWSYSDFNPPPLQLTQAGTYHFIVTLVDLNTGVSVSDTVIAYVHAPVVDAGPPSISICTGDTATLVGTGVGLINYQWNTNPITYNDSVLVSPTVTTTYTVQAKDIFGCAAKDSILVNFNQKPTIVITNGSACIGDTAHLSASGGSKYLWTSTLDTTATIAVSPTVTTTYQVKVTTMEGCSDTASATATINPKPQIQLTNNTTICKGDNAILTAGGGIKYLWNTPAMDSTATISVSPASLTTYTVLVTDINDCFDSKSVDVAVIDVPVPIILQDIDTICKGTSTTLTASGGSNFLWSTGETTASILIAPYLTSTYTVTASNTLNNVECTATATTQLNVRNCNMIYIPNSFAPFGLNPIFKPMGEIKSARNYSFQIFNRWGQLIFETSDPEKGWDGKHNGEYVQSGAYIYYLKFDNIDEKFEKVGTVTILF